MSGKENCLTGTCIAAAIATSAIAGSCMANDMQNSNPVTMSEMTDNAKSNIAKKEIDLINAEINTVLANEIKADFNPFSPENKSNANESVSDPFATVRKKMKKDIQNSSPDDSLTS